jgi:hypothetical protein
VRASFFQLQHYGLPQNGNRAEPLGKTATSLNAPLSICIRILALFT